jgi:hypothetical protein
LIANKLDIQLQNLTLHKTEFHHNYWNYNKTGEKLRIIFISIVVEILQKAIPFLRNHAGSEKGCFITATREHIPALILIDFGRREIINVQGKKYCPNFSNKSSHSF